MTPDDIAQWSTVAQSSGLTAGGFLALMTFLLWKGLLYTKPQVERERTLAAESRKTELEAKDTIIESISAERDRETVDKVYYRTAETAQRDRAETIQSRVSEEIVPLLRVTNKIIAALPGVEDGE